VTALIYDGSSDYPKGRRKKVKKKEIEKIHWRRVTQGLTEWKKKGKKIGSSRKEKGRRKSPGRKGVEGPQALGLSLQMLKRKGTGIEN